MSTARDAVFIFATTYGVPVMIALVVSHWWIANPRPQARYRSLCAGVSFLLGLGAAQVMLLFIHRTRPYDVGVSHLIVAETSDWSFPSDHAIASMSIVWTYVLLGSRKWAAVLLGLAALVCFSRIYVGMHYVSDILGGAAVALVAVMLVTWLYRPNQKLNGWLTGLF